MAGRLSSASRYRSLRASRAALGRTAWLVRLGLYAAGCAAAFGEVRPMLSDAQFTWGERRVTAIVVVTTLGGFGLAAWIAGRLLRLAGELIEVVVAGADSAAMTAALVDQQLVPGLNRIAAALERLAPPPAAGGPRDDGRAGPALRAAIRQGRWGQAERIAREASGSAGGSALLAELSEAREREVERLRARLDAAVQSEDPEAVIDARDALTLHLRGDPLRDLDGRTVRWLAQTIRRRSRAGAVGADLARLAARVAETFGDTPEGASVDAELPEIRRRAGLCPRCARPHRGRAGACPDCLEREDESDALPLA